MWVKALIKWLLMLFKWGQTALEPIANTLVTDPALPPTPMHAGAPSSPHFSGSVTLLDLAAEVAELRSEVRALRRTLVERA